MFEGYIIVGLIVTTITYIVEEQEFNLGQFIWTVILWLPFLIFNFLNNTNHD